MLKKIYSRVVIALSASTMISFSLIPACSMESEKSVKENIKPNNTNKIFIEEKNNRSTNKIDVLLNDKTNYSIKQFCEGNKLFMEEKYSDAFDCYNLSADQGHAEAQFKVGEMYLKGLGVNKNIKKAYEYFEHASNLGCVDAQNKLGHENLYEKLFLEGDKFYEEKNYSEAFGCYKVLANQGCYKSQFNVARMYCNGLGVAKNVIEAFYIFKHAANNGCVKSQNILKDNALYKEIFDEGDKHYQEKKYLEAVQCYRIVSHKGCFEADHKVATMYYEGQGVDMNLVKAFGLFNALASKGHTESQFQVANMYYKGLGVDKNVKKALSEFKNLANQGHVEAQRILRNKGFYNELFCEGQKLYQEEKYSEAYDCYYFAANGGHVESKFQVGKMNYKGVGVAKDVNKAFTNFKVSAQKKHREAQYYLGRMYFYGIATEKNITKALVFLKDSADHGFVPAQTLVGTVCLNNDDKDASIIMEAFKYLMLAANASVPEAKKYVARAQEHLGYVYHCGMGLEKADKKKSLDYYTLAADNGHIESQFMVGAMYLGLIKGIAEDFDMAFKYFMSAANEGHNDAQFNIGKMYANGMGVEQDWDTAFNYFVPLVNDGHVSAQEYMFLAAKDGHVSAQETMYSLWSEGDIVNQDLEENFENLMLSNDKDPNVQYEMGSFFCREAGADEDLVGEKYNKAFSYWMLAADKAHVLAQYCVAYMYYAGCGIDQDDLMARHYMRIYMASKLEISDEVVLLSEGLYKLLMKDVVNEFNSSNILWALGKIPSSERERAIDILSRLKNGDAEEFNAIISSNSECLRFFDILQIRFLELFNPHKHLIFRWKK